MTAAEEAKSGETTMTWTTWEELLLACAVKRHGLKDWDSVTMEIQTRTSSLCTPQICRDKYLELKRRYVDEPAAVDEAEVEVEEEVEIPWIEELRKLRVAELTQEVQRYDLSIQSLQSKVKRLEDEHERSQKDNQVTDGEKPDLETDSKTNISENDKIDEADETPAEVSPTNSAGKEITGEHSDRSFNESNSSENREEKASAGGGMESEPVITGDEDVKPDPDSKMIRENSCNDSSDTVARQLVASRRSKEEAEDSKEGTTTTKESSDVQSSASLTKKKRRKEASRRGGGVEEEPIAVSPATTANASVKKEGVVVKSEPLVAVMDIIRAHKHGSMFGRRLESQKTEKYNKIIRRHVDLRIVQARIDDGSYSSCANKFFLDLLLIFNNAIVFFPKSSPESIAAHAHRNLVLNEMRKKKPIDKNKPNPISESEPFPIRPKPDLERSDSLLAKQKSAAPIVVCRKRSSISGKPSSANKVVEKETAAAKPLAIPKPLVKTSSNEEEGSMKMKEKPVTGARSMRRSGVNTNRTINSSNTSAGTNNNPLLSTSSNLGNATSKGSDARASPPSPKVEKKKAEVITSIVKKRGAADFLKRIKKTSPGKGNVAENSKGSGEDGGGSRKGSDQVKKKVVEEGRDAVAARQRSGGGRQVKEDISPSKRGVGRPPKKGKEVVPAKRGRETVESESKRPAKRTRRDK